MIQIKIPKLEDLRLYHLEAIQSLKSEGLNAHDKVMLLSKLTGLDFEELKYMSLSDIDKVINAYFKLFASIDKSNPSKEINVNGKKFELIGSFSELPARWHIDASNFDLKDMAVLAAFCYIEKGMDYCEMDKHKNVKNPVRQRAELFREYMPMEHFVKLGFFLNTKAVNYTRAYTAIRRQRKLIEKDKQALMSGS